MYPGEQMDLSYIGLLSDTDSEDTEEKNEKKEKKWEKWRKLNKRTTKFISSTSSNLFFIVLVNHA